MTDEQKRLVRRLMERCAHEIDLKGTIDFFGLDESHEHPVTVMSDAWRNLAKEVGYELPQPGSLAGCGRPNLRSVS